MTESGQWIAHGESLVGSDTSAFTEDSVECPLCGRDDSLNAGSNLPYQSSVIECDRDANAALNVLRGRTISHVNRHIQSRLAKPVSKRVTDT